MPVLADKPVLIVGATGRLGRAVVAALGPTNVRAVARNRCEIAEQWPSFVAADAANAKALRPLLQGVRAVVHTALFQPDQAIALLQADPPPGLPLLWFSSLAARPLSVWTEPPQAPSWQPLDEYGQGKYEVERLLTARWPGPVTTVLISQVVAVDDAKAREIKYLQDFASTGSIAVAGLAQNRPAVIDAGTAAAWVAWALQQKDQALGPVYLTHPHPEPLQVLLEALLRGAGLGPLRLRAPSSGQRTVHSGSDEVVRLHEMLAQLPADFPWPPLPDAYQALGRFLATRSLC